MKRMLTALYVVILVCFSASLQAQQHDVERINQSTREKASDRIVHIYEEMIYKMPDIPSLCDELNYRGEMTDIGDCKLYVEIAGKGTPLLLINGGPGSTHHCFHPWFARAEEFSRVIYHDQRGTGKSDYYPGDGYSVDQAIEDIELLRKKLGIDKWLVLGHSYGGFLAQYYSVKYPENVKGLILVSAATGLHNKDLFKSREQVYISDKERSRIREIVQHFRSGQTGDSFENLRLLVYNNHRNGDWKRQSYYKPDSISMVRQIKYGFAYDHRNNFTRIMNYSRRSINLEGKFDDNPIPTLIIEGLYDLTWGRAKASLFAENHPGAKLLIFSNSGHSPFKDEPGLFFNHLNNFIDTLPEVAGKQLSKYKTGLEQGPALYNDDNLDSQISDSELDNIESYKNTLKKILEGHYYFSQETPLDCHLSFISACLRKDTLGAFRLTYRNWDINYLENRGKSLAERKIMRIPGLKDSYRDGDIEPVYFSRTEGGRRDWTFLFIYWQGLWYRTGNIDGPYWNWKQFEESTRNYFFRDIANIYSDTNNNKQNE